MSSVMKSSDIFRAKYLISTFHSTDTVNVAKAQNLYRRTWMRSKSISKQMKSSFLSLPSRLLSDYSYYVRHTKQLTVCVSFIHVNKNNTIRGAFAATKIRNLPLWFGNGNAALPRDRSPIVVNTETNEMKMELFDSRILSFIKCVRTIIEHHRKRKYSREKQSKKKERKKNPKRS